MHGFENEAHELILETYSEYLITHMFVEPFKWYSAQLSESYHKQLVYKVNSIVFFFTTLFGNDFSSPLRTNYS